MDLPKIDKEPIQHQIDYVRFDFYDSNTVRRISMKPLTDPVAFDTINTPTKGGLHDPALGVSAYDRVGSCQSCGQNSNDCTGHFGHLELSAVLYNPFMLNYILKLVRNKCFFCHRLRMTEKDKLYIFMKILLIKLGLFKEATELQTLMFSTMMESTSLVQRKIADFLSNFSHCLKFNNEEEDESVGAAILERDRQPSIDTTNTDDTEEITKKKKNKKSELNSGDQLLQNEKKMKEERFKHDIEVYKYKRIEEIVKKILDLNDEMYNNGNKTKFIFDQSLNNNIILKDAVNEFWKIVKSGKCPHCDAINSRIKKVGNIKFFQCPLSKKVIKRMKKSGIDPNKDALDFSNFRKESEDDSEEEEVQTKIPKNSDPEKNKNESDDDSDEESIDIHNEDSLKYLHPLEIKEHIKKLWDLDGDLLSLVFGNLISKNQNSKLHPKEENISHDGSQSTYSSNTNSMNYSQVIKDQNDFYFTISSTGVQIFFIDSLIVPPNRFRPENKGGSDGGTYLHGQTAVLTKLLNLSNELRRLSMQNHSSGLKKSQDGKQEAPEQDDSSSINIDPEKTHPVTMKDIITKWTEMQDTLNILFDSTKASNKKDGDKNRGIKQLLEKKEGVYRTKMMGKRVNFAGRSVISPDPMVDADWVGIPLYIAQKLSYAETVTEHNKEKLKSFVINGSKSYPGATMMVNSEGRTVSFDFVNENYRKKLAENLKIGETVHRHLLTGDILLVNRQPTLHKSSIMSHKARVLPNEKTIRLHYANCNTYNADFDGDEMNIHFLQNHIARQEAYTISNTENQYIVPTSGNPIRGLIQDSVVSAVFLTMKNRFFSRDEYQQLVYSCLAASLNNDRIKKISIVQPAFIKPKIVYTGKQVITSVLKSLAEEDDDDNNKPGLNFEHWTRINHTSWGLEQQHEAKVIVRNNEMLTGVLDKNHIGNADFGLVHSFYEIYGPSKAGELISVLGKLFINYLQFFHGFTCGVDDILLKEESNLKRRVDIEGIIMSGMKGLATYFDIENFDLRLDNYSKRSVITREKKPLKNVKIMTQSDKEEIEKLCKLQNMKIENIYKKLNNEEEDEIQKIKNSDESSTSGESSKEKIQILKEKYFEIVLKDETKTIDANVDTIVKNAIFRPSSDCSKSWLGGLKKSFPSNCFSMMVMSGAKGSTVNHSQITCMLGQQELEGRRVPRMASGRTLPSFEPFDPNPRAGGFVSDRFSTGIRPQEFFFHCMAGREGLIDTAVKTSRSGYLQRCLVKHLEQLMVNYDYTVRDTDGNVIQFLYGEDSVDVINTKYLTNFKFIQNNIDTYFEKYKPERLASVIDTKTVKKVKRNFDSTKDTMISQYDPWRHLGSVSENLEEAMNKYISAERDGKIQINDFDKSNFRLVVYLKYLNSLIQPGESVGILAAQSVGEPSTQMTLNTFHLAGHGGVNMTLGIPRLREILMTSEKNIKTPIMILPMLTKNLDLVKKLARKFERYALIDLVKEISTKQNIIFNNGRNKLNSEKYRNYFIQIKTENLNDIEDYFELGRTAIESKFKLEFVPKLARGINRAIKLSGRLTEIIVKNRKGKKSNNEDEEKEETNEADEDVAEIPDEAFHSTKKRKEEDDERENSDEREYEDDTDTNKDADNEDTFVDNTEEVDEEGQNEEADEENLEDREGEEEKEEEQEKEKEKDTLDVKLRNKNYSYEDVKISEMNLDETESIFSFEITLPYHQKNILLKNILDETMKSISFKSIKNIKKCHVIEGNDDKNNPKPHSLQLEGVNFEEVFKYQDYINIDKIVTNDVGSILHRYGIEACRAAIVNEINNVFKAYNITVNIRHLGLIADYMTHQGDYRSFNRKGLSTASSPFLKMTFESTMQYMIQACISKEVDDGKTASSRIILGQVPQSGTGIFSLMQSAVRTNS